MTTTTLRNPSLEDLDRQTVLRPVPSLDPYDLHASGDRATRASSSGGKGIRIRDRKGAS